jgi:hypothetical protein
MIMIKKKVTATHGHGYEDYKILECSLVVYACSTNVVVNFY